MSTFTLHSRQAPFTARPALGAGLRRLLDRLAPSRGLTLGALTLAGLLGFELFNYGTTEFALTDLLGWQAFAGVRWATILALAFCAVDFAGIARLFTPDPARKDPAEIWYLLGAWFLAATMNAMLTWWGISLALLRHQGLGNEILGREALLGSVPVFVALLVWLIRVLMIGTVTLAGRRLLAPGAARVARPTRPPEAMGQPAAAARPRPAAAGLSGQASGYARRAVSGGPQPRR